VLRQEKYDNTRIHRRKLMKESLGLNISNNFIRYAKIQNDGNKIKVKALGVKIYDRNPKAVINQIIQETKSEKAIINTNTVAIMFPFVRSRCDKYWTRKILFLKNLKYLYSRDFFQRYLFIFCSKAYI